MAPLLGVDGLGRYVGTLKGLYSPTTRCSVLLSSAVSGITAGVSSFLGCIAPEPRGVCRAVLYCLLHNLLIFSAVWRPPRHCLNEKLGRHVFPFRVAAFFYIRISGIFFAK